MPKGKGKKRLNKGKNPLEIPTSNLTRSRSIKFKGHKKAENTPPKIVTYMGVKYSSITEAAKKLNKSRTTVSRLIKTSKFVTK